MPRIDPIIFDVDEARRELAELRDILREYRAAMDILEREIREADSWWKGDSIIPFKRLGDKLLADRKKVEAMLQARIDGLELAIREMEEVERIGKGMFDADPGILHATVPILAGSRENIDNVDIDAEIAELENSFKPWNTLQDWMETGRREYLDIRLEKLLDSLISETHESPAGVGPITVIKIRLGCN